MTWALGFVGGVMLWTLLEYVLHRFVFHEKQLGKRAAHEHLTHHARVDWFAPLVYKVSLATPVIGGIALLGTVVSGRALGISLPLGTFAAWVTYEMIHRGIHLRGASGAYGRWTRRHHLLHHFGHPMENYGVTSPLWDWVFGTWAAREVVRLPARHAVKFKWLVQFKRGEIAIAEGLEQDYELLTAQEKTAPMKLAA